MRVCVCVCLRLCVGTWKCVCVCGKQAFSVDGFIVHDPGVSSVRMEKAVVILSEQPVSYRWKCGFINGKTVSGVLGLLLCWASEGETG